MSGLSRKSLRLETLSTVEKRESQYLLLVKVEAAHYFGNHLNSGPISLYIGAMLQS